MSDNESVAPGLSRRTVTKAAAWAVPAIVFAAPVPAFAASSDVAVSITGSCAGSGPTGSFTFTSGPIPVGQEIVITLSHSGAGSFGSSVNFVASGMNPYTITGTGAAVSGVITVSFTLPTNGTGRVTATVSSGSGALVSGKLTGFVEKRRDGNSSNYNQCSAG
ncbi:hypothetical protein [Microbacterium sp. NPDC064584]|uniref:hypothetical protein n=1 Tax=Microbacterium sp. NPDC064584 TaxID=3155817 RepID=UPI003435475A